MAGVPAGSKTFFRVGPAEPANASTFALKWGNAERLDAWFNHPRYTLLNDRLDSAQVPTPHLREFLLSIAGGATPKRSDASLYTDSGVKFLRILNIDDGEIAERDLKYITDEVHQVDLARSQLVSGDVLMTITGRVGSAAVAHNEHLPANINQHIARLRVNTARCRPEFLSEWLNCSAGQELSNRFVSGGTRAALDYGAIRGIRIPLPEYLETQDRLLAAMDAARAERKAKLAEADALLAGVDDYALDALGLAPPQADSRRVFAVDGKSAQQRFDPHFHSPEFAQIQEMLSRTQCESLGNITAFSKEMWRPENHDQPTFRYIEISAVDPKTGEAHWNDVPITAAPSRARMKIRADDIIVSLTRPHHGSIAHLGPEFDECIASTGFAVIRDVAQNIHRDYLWCVLRARFSLNQMIQRASGGNYPAITEQELTNIIVPIPDIDVQQTIAAEINLRREEARRLRAEAEAGWQTARRWFEAQLLGTG